MVLLRYEKDCDLFVNGCGDVWGGNGASDKYFCG